MDAKPFQVMNVGTIIATPVEQSRSQKLLFNQLGMDWLRFEHGAYIALTEAVSSYNGSLWDFYELSNGGFYMAPCGLPSMRVIGRDNGFDGTLSADAAGIYACAMALSHLSFQTKSNVPSIKFYQLRDFYMDHPEARAIMRALD